MKQTERGFCGIHLKNKICAILCPEIIVGKLLDYVKGDLNGSALHYIVPDDVHLVVNGANRRAATETPGFNIL